MSKFFKRGNVSLSWDLVPPQAEYVCVSEDSSVLCSTTEPIAEENGWSVDMGLFEHVGEMCEDWEELLFKRPKDD